MDKYGIGRSTMSVRASNEEPVLMLMYSNAGSVSKTNWELLNQKDLPIDLVKTINQCIKIP